MTAPVQRPSIEATLRDILKRIRRLEAVNIGAAPPTSYQDYIERFIVPDFYFPGNDVSGCLVDVMQGQQLCPNAGSHVYGITSGVPTGVETALGVASLEAFLNPNAPAAGGPLLTSVDDFSWQTWAFQAAATANVRFLLENGKMFAGPTTGWAVRFLGATNEFQWDFSDGSSINQSGTSVEGAWYHLLGTMDAGTATLYINGTSVGTATPTIGTPTQNTMWGNWAGNVTAANGWNGQFSQLILVDRVLTADEIANLYDYGLNGV